MVRKPKSTKKPRSWGGGTFVKAILPLILLVCLYNPMYAHYTASKSETTDGDGTWGAILYMRVDITDGNEIKFTLRKQDGNFKNDNEVYLRTGSHTGETIAQGMAKSGDYEWTTTLRSPFKESKSFYFYAVNFEGESWVGPIQLNYSNTSPNNLVVIAEPTSGNTGQSLTYTYKASDPDNDLMRMHISWGDGTGTWKSDFETSGTEFSQSHVYSNAGTYDLYATAFDEHGDGTNIRHAVVTITDNPNIDYTLTVNSSPGAADIEVSPVDTNGQGNGTTEFTRTYKNGTEVTLKAPIIHKDKLFARWEIDNSIIDRNITIKVNMDQDHSVKAVFKKNCTLTVHSVPQKASISVSPADLNGEADGVTMFKREYNCGTTVTLTAPETHNKKNFSRWEIDGKNDNVNRVIQIEVDDDYTARAIYGNDPPGCLKVGKLELCADSISQEGDVYTLSGNVNISGKLQFSGNVTYTRHTDTEGILFSHGYPYVTLKEGALPILNDEGKTYNVDGIAETLKPAFQDVANLALALAGIPIEFTSSPMVVNKNGVYVSGGITIGSYISNLGAVNITMLYVPGDKEYLTYAKLSAYSSSNIPGIKATDIQLNYDPIYDYLGGQIKLDFPYLGLSGIEASLHAQAGCIDGFEITVALSRTIPLGATGLKITGLTLEVENMCNFAQVYIFLGGNIGIASIPTKIFSVERAGLGYQHPYHLELEGGTIKLFEYPIASLKGYLDASGELDKTGFGIEGNIDLAGVYKAKIELEALIKLLRFTGSAQGALYIPDFECASWSCIIKAAIEIFVDLPYELSQQRLDIELSKETGAWTGGLKGMVSIFDLSLAAALEYYGGKLHFSIGWDYDDMIQIFRNSQLKVLSNSVEQTLTLPFDKEGVIFAAVGNTRQPEIYLKSPHGEVIIPTEVGNYDGIYYNTSTENKITLFFLRKAKAGTWTLGTSNLSVDEVTFKILGKRELAETSFTKVKKSDNNVEINASVNKAQKSSRVSFFYSQKASGHTGSPIVEKLPVTNGKVSATWDISSVQSGTYFIFSKTYDDKNPPVVTYHTSPISIDHNIIAPPTELQGSFAGDSATLTWTPSKSKSVVGYSVRYTDEPEVGGYKYQKSAATKDYAFIEGLDPEKDYCFKVVAFDQDGNFSSESNTYCKSYETLPKIDLDRTSLTFGTLVNKQPSAQTINISNGGSGKLKWSADSPENWLQISPKNGSGKGTIKVKVNTTGLGSGSYTGTIIISDDAAYNSPQKVSVKLNVYNSGQTSPPFGEFATPEDNSTVNSSVPVTGWALDDIEVESVQIYNGQSYLGDAVFVEGARPDVESSYPDYPLNYRAGWGFMLLTNTLPNGGNGTFNIRAVATDTDGHQVTLGTKTIKCNNANARKPFGAIETPTPGGITSGNNFINWGWALTPKPNKIPIDGSTIDVYVDGVKIGNPIYNVYREDIATLFPGYANSNGAVGHFTLDTTAYEDGSHSIQWVVTDDAGNTDGIGSRYFTIQNSGNSRSQYQSSADQYSRLLQNNELPLNDGLASIEKGFAKRARTAQGYPDENGHSFITIRELERMVITPEQGTSFVHGYSMIGKQMRRLPIGSSIDTETGSFNWIPGPGFFGLHQLVLIVRDQDGNLSQKRITIDILPKHQEKD